MKFDSKAERDKFILDNQNLVYKIVNTYYKSHIYDEDFKQAGLECLIRAVDNFKDKKKIKFSSYACECIRLGLLRYIYEPRNQRYLTLGTRNAKNKNVYEHYPCVSLNYEIPRKLMYDLEETNTFAEILEARDAHKGQFSILSKDFQEDIDNKILLDTAFQNIVLNSKKKRITPKVKKVMYLWFYKELGVVQIAKKLGLSKQTVSYIIIVYRNKLREYLKTKLPQEELKYLTKGS